MPSIRASSARTELPRHFRNAQQDIGIRPGRRVKQMDEGQFGLKHPNTPPRSPGAFEVREHPDDWRDVMRFCMGRRTRGFIIRNFAGTDAASSFPRSANPAARSASASSRSRPPPPLFRRRMRRCRWRTGNSSLFRAWKTSPSSPTPRAAAALDIKAVTKRFFMDFPDQHLAFRVNPREAVRARDLESLFHNREVQIEITPADVVRLSPASLSIIEFRDALDYEHVAMTASFPRLAGDLTGTWNIRLQSEFHMTNDSRLLHEKPFEGVWPPVEGK